MEVGSTAYRLKPRVFRPSQFPHVPSVAPAMARGTHGRAEFLEADLFIKAHGGVHAAQGFQVARFVAQFLGHGKAVAQQLFTRASATGFIQEIHLSQFANTGFATFELGNAAPTDDPSVRRFHHEIGSAGDGIRRAHSIHLWVMDGEARPIGTELRHHRADDRRDRRVVLGMDGAEGECVGHGTIETLVDPRVGGQSFGLAN